ncbi:MAG: ribbon-helix-helix domain-containing protein, partial [Nostoc sp.]
DRLAEDPKKVDPGESLADDKTDSKVPPSRRGKKAIVGHFSPEFCKQIKRLALNQDKSSQELLAEALRDLLRKYGEEPIA